MFIKKMKNKIQHYEKTALISASSQDVFNYVDDHKSFSSHMNKSSWMMGGGSMDTELDEGQGKVIGSHIRMKGKIFGINLFLDEIVTHREPPHRKVWETVGIPKLLVIGNYTMGFEINSENNNSRLRVFIDYELPTKKSTQWLGQLFGDMYAKWCVRLMINGVTEHFRK
jgi:hypothetical protein